MKAQERKETFQFPNTRLALLEPFLLRMCQARLKSARRFQESPKIFVLLPNETITIRGIRNERSREKTEEKRKRLNFQELDQLSLLGLRVRGATEMAFDSHRSAN